MKSKQNMIALVIVSVILLVAVALLAIPYFFVSENLVAVVSVDGHPSFTVNLKDADDQTIDLNDQYNINIILEVSNHKIRFQSSDCPDKICVHSGYLSKDLDMAACIPNKTAIFIQKED